MKKRTLLFIATLLILGTTSIAISTISDPENHCTKEKYATPEPGVCLNPKAYRLLKALDRIDKENIMKKKAPKRMLDFFEPRVYKTIDTLVSHIEYDVPVRIYYPKRKMSNTPSQIIMFIHGGGFILGSVDEYDMAVKKLAKTTECIIVSVDYRLAPDHPYPAAINDVVAVLDWLRKNNTNIGGNGKGICVIGDSAGANLATVLSIKCRDTGRSCISSQVLYYPPTTFEENEYPSRIHFLRDTNRTYLLTEEFIMKAKNSYMKEGDDLKDPYLSPLVADLTGDIPPALIITAQCDPLRDEGRLYAEKLSLNGQDVYYKEYEGMIHGFMNFYMLFDESRASMKLVKNFIETGSIEN